MEKILSKGETPAFWSRLAQPRQARSIEQRKGVGNPKGWREFDPCPVGASACLGRRDAHLVGVDGVQPPHGPVHLRQGRPRAIAGDRDVGALHHGDVPVSHGDAREVCGESDGSYETDAKASERPLSVSAFTSAVENYHSIVP